MNEQEIEADVPEEVDAPEIETVEPSEPVKDWSDDDEAEARAFGWKPPEEWKGHKPEGFIDDPRQYIDRAMTFKPFRTLKDRFEQETRQFDDRIRKMEAMNERALDMQRKQYETRLEDIRQQKVAAVDMADKDAYTRLDREEQATRDAMMRATQPEPQRQAPAPDPWVQEYSKSDDGKWLNDPTMISVGSALIEQNPHIQRLPPADQVKWAEQQLRKEFPDRFTPTERPAQRQVVDGGGLAGGKSSDPFSKLPKEAREVFHRYVKEGVVKDTKEARTEWAEEYNAA